MKTILTMITALLFNAFTGAVVGMTLGVSPVAGQMDDIVVNDA